MATLILAFGKPAVTTAVTTAGLRGIDECPELAQASFSEAACHNSNMRCGHDQRESRGQNVQTALAGVTGVADPALA